MSFLLNLLIYVAPYVEHRLTGHDAMYLQRFLVDLATYLHIFVAVGQG